MQRRSEKRGEVPRRKLQYVLTVYAPVDASLGQVKSYIEDSLCWSGGCRMPPGTDDEFPEEDQMFYSLDKVTARRIKPKGVK